jgi:hypothetical protein
MHYSAKEIFTGQKKLIKKARDEVTKRNIQWYKPQATDGDSEEDGDDV